MEISKTVFTSDRLDAHIEAGLGFGVWFDGYTITVLVGPLWVNITI